MAKVLALQVQKTLAMAESMGMSTETKSRATALLQAMPEVPDQDYSFHAGGILDLLQQLPQSTSDAGILPCVLKVP